MSDYTELVKALRHLSTGRCDDLYGCEPCAIYETCLTRCVLDAAAAIEALQAEVKRLQGKLCDWCAVCPKERRRPEDCEMLSETPVMYGPSDAKMEVQE